MSHSLPQTHLIRALSTHHFLCFPSSIQLSSLAVHRRRAAQFNGQGFSIYPLTAPLVWLEVYEAIKAASRFLANHPYTVLDLPALSEDEDAEDHAHRRLESIPPAIPPPPAPSAANLRHHPVRAYDVNAEIEKLRQQYDKATRRLKAAVQACQAARAKADALPENTWDRNLAEAYVRRTKEALKVAVVKEAAAEGDVFEDQANLHLDLTNTQAN
ncbi:hypothetical protein GY45DRAFT_1341383 [Cubamyces sp. BRFM 1775]|nr:hypothetical protein GY45DRAFT_1341383 [Cubamyces sp. BRFM 1775]